MLHALLEVLVEDLYAASLAPRPRPEEPIRALEATIRQFMHAYRDRAGLIRILEQVASFSPDFLTLRLEIKSRFTALIEAGVRGQGHAGAGRPDARYLAQALGAMVEDMAYTSYVLTAPLDEQEAVSTMAFIWLQAVGAGAPLPTSHGRRRPCGPRRPAPCGGSCGAQLCGGSSPLRPYARRG